MCGVRGIGVAGEAVLSIEGGLGPNVAYQTTSRSVAEPKSKSICVSLVVDVTNK